MDGHLGWSSNLLTGVGHGLRGGEKNRGAVLTSLQLTFRGHERDFTPFTILLFNKLCFQWKLCQTHLGSFSMLQTSPTQFRNRVFYINSYWNILLIKIGKHVLLKHFPNRSSEHNCFNTNYSGTPPYGHLSNTVTSILQPLFWPPGKNRHAFSCRKNLVNTAKFFWSIGDCILGFHLTVKQLLKPPDTKARNFWQGLSFCLFVAIISIHFADTLYVFIQNSPTGYLA